MTERLMSQNFWYPSSFHIAGFFDSYVCNPHITKLSLSNDGRAIRRRLYCVYGVYDVYDLYSVGS